MVGFCFIYFSINTLLNIIVNFTCVLFVIILAIIRHQLTLAPRVDFIIYFFLMFCLYFIIYSPYVLYFNFFFFLVLQKCIFFFEFCMPTMSSYGNCITLMSLNFNCVTVLSDFYLTRRFGFKVMVFLVKTKINVKVTANLKFYKVRCLNGGIYL